MSQELKNIQIQLTNLQQRIRESDIYSREIPDATREFEEVVRKHVLSSIPKDVKIDASEGYQRYLGWW